MSVDYASGLSNYDDLGVCGLDETCDGPELLEEKIEKLALLIRQSKKCIVHVGAGISTSAGIPDFRGPRGVWTKQMQQEKTQNENQNDRKRCKYDDECYKDNSAKNNGHGEISFDSAIPTFTHRALCSMIERKIIDYIVSQNVDGLFLKCNIPRKYISELHGNFFLDECTVCKQRFIRSKASSTMGLKKSCIKCPRGTSICPRGSLRDTILDWESPVPRNELLLAERESKSSDLHICMGTTLQLLPANKLPIYSKKNKGNLVIINLQPIKLNERADLVINGYVDDVMRRLTKLLDVDVMEYDESLDPTKCEDKIGRSWLRRDTETVDERSSDNKNNALSTDEAFNQTSIKIELRKKDEVMENVKYLTRSSLK